MGESLRESFEESASRRRAEEWRADEARRAAGMNFWRLASVVAVGILLSQLVSGAVTWVLGYLLHPPQ
jgi:hypothetical protein